VTSRERAAFARAARFWRNEVRYLYLSRAAREASNDAHRATSWASKLPWPEREEVAQVAESLSLDGVAVYENAEAAALLDADDRAMDFT
jgi:hypothetical protein